MAYKLTDDQNYSDIADAIRGKTGSSDTFLPSEMASAIENIPTGGSSETKTIFIDYDGTILYEYTQAEVDALTELPELPTHEGLTAQEWNWTLEEIQALERPVVVGVNYITDDGKTRIYITIPEVDKKVYMTFAMSPSFEGTLNWGDGNTEEVSSSSRRKNHTYEESGDYVIELDITEGTAGLTGGSSEGTHLIWSNLDRTGGASAYVTKIELGNNIGVANYAFMNMFNLQTITIPSYITIANYLFDCDYNLKCIVIPKGITSINTYLAYDCLKLKYAALPNSIEDIKADAFYNCISLLRTTLSDEVVSIGKYAFYYCGALEKPFINFSSNIEVIEEYAFSTANGIGENVVFSSDLRTIGSSAFSNTDIEEVVINSAVSIASSAFSSCKKLKKVTIGGTGITLAGNMFERCYNLEEVIFTEGVQALPNYLFQHDNSLRVVQLPESLESIGNSALLNAWRLKEIELPDALETIGTSAFSMCYSVEKLVVPEGVTVVNGSAFDSMYSLRELIFLGDIQSVNGSAFYEDYQIRVIDFTNCTSVPTFSGAGSFPKPDDDTIEIRVPASLYDTWISASGWSSIADYIVAV